MTLATAEELAAALGTHVDAPPDDAAYVKQCAGDAVEFILTRAPNTTTTDDPPVTTNPLGDALYKREVLELGAELYYRRKARNGVVTVANDGTPIRVSADPYGASGKRIAGVLALGFS